MLNLKLITPPAVEPVSLSLAKSHLRIDIDDDDSLIGGYIAAARQYAERYTKRAFFNQAWQLSLDHFPLFDGSSTLPTRSRQDWPFYSSYYDSITIRLPRPSCVSVQSITYIDQTGTQQTLSPSAYYADTSSEPARIVPVPGTFWPYTQAYLPSSVKVLYVAGSYGDGVTVNTCPQTVVMAILLLVAHYYQNREGVSEMKMSEVPFAVGALLNMERFDCFSYDGN